MRISRAWDRFWFQPQETLTIGVVRALIGFLLLCWCALLAPYLSTWFTSQGIVPLDVAQAFDGPGHFSFLFLFTSDRAVYVVFAVLLLSSLLMMVGLYTRVSSICVYLCLLSFHHRDLVILNSGDTMLKMMVFFLCLAPAGASFSLDSLRRQRRSGGESRNGTTAPGVNGESVGVGKPRGWQWFRDELICACPGRMAPPWAQRLIQIQISLVYMSTFLWKVPGMSWRTGYAMYIVGNLSEMQRFPLPPFFHTNFFVNLQTWFGLVAEFSMGFLVWFPATRIFALLLGCLLHLGIEYTMNIPLFATIMAVSYLTFLNLSELRDRFLMTAWGRAAADRLGRSELLSDAAAGNDASGNGARNSGDGSAGSRSGAGEPAESAALQKNGRSANRSRPNRR